MHSVPDFVPKIYLVHISGERWAFKNIVEAAFELKRLRFFNSWESVIGDDFKKRWTWSDVSYYQSQYIVTTEFGDSITVNELREITRIPRKWWNRWNYNPDKDFRNGPLRGSSFRRCSGGSYRRPKTTQERRIAYAHDYDDDLKFYGVKVRAKRNFRNLPDVYDDLVRSNESQKNWKRYRKIQYKTKQ